MGISRSANINLRDQFFEIRNAVLDGALDPEFVLICEEAVEENPQDQLTLDYLRTVNTVNIAYATWGDDFIVSLNIDPRDVLI